MDRHHFYDYFHLFGLATIHMPFFSHEGRSLGSVQPVMTFCVKMWLTATTTWLASVDVEKKLFKISPRPCQGASVSNCSENGNANKIDGFSFFLFFLFCLEGTGPWRSGLSKNTGGEGVAQFIKQGIGGGRAAPENRHNRVTLEITQSVSLSLHPPFLFYFFSFTLTFFPSPFIFHLLS